MMLILKQILEEVLLNALPGYFCSGSGSGLRGILRCWFDALYDLAFSLVRARLRFLCSITKVCHHVMTFGHRDLEIEDFPYSFSVLSEAVCCRVVFSVLPGLEPNGVPCRFFPWCHFLHRKFTYSSALRSWDTPTSLHGFISCQHTLLYATMKIGLLWDKMKS